MWSGTAKFWQVPALPWTGGDQRGQAGCPDRTARQGGGSGLASWGPLGAEAGIGSTFEDFPFCSWGTL